MEMLKIKDVGKTFTLHVQGGVHIPVISGVELTVSSGEAVALAGPSGAGKSSLMRMLYGNYLCSQGQIFVRHETGWTDIACADPRTILELRKHTIGYISQFLRVIPRVPALQVVSEPLRARGVEAEEAEARAKEILNRLDIPKALWSLSPVTFSGGEQQRINIARGFSAFFPLLLLDEPTASLDTANRENIVALIREARDKGAAIVGIFHDEAVRDAVCDRVCDLTEYRLAS